MSIFSHFNLNLALETVFAIGGVSVIADAADRRAAAFGEQDAEPWAPLDIESIVAAEERGVQVKASQVRAFPCLP